jgi:uncharacterized protein (TIGR03437 family)
VSLVQPPLSLSISPDGLHAAVGHDALISYVNLVTLAVETKYPVPVTAGSVALSASWIYVMPTYEGGSVSVNIATGAVTNNTGVFYGSKGWLNTYFTGGGFTTPAGTTGSVNGAVLKRLSQTALATVGGQPGTVEFAGAAPSFLDGVGQLNLRLGLNTPAGARQPLILTVGINSGPDTATIAVR